jgi:hypothetical protein
MVEALREQRMQFQGQVGRYWIESGEDTLEARPHRSKHPGKGPGVVESQGLNKEPRLRVGVWGITWGVSRACSPGSGIAPLVAKRLRRSIRCSSAYFTICIFYCEDLPWQNKACDRDAYEKTQMNREKVKSRLFGRPCDCSIIAEKGHNFIIIVKAGFSCSTNIPYIYI